MRYDAILFDLDGTLTDSGPGIMRCAAETFVHYGVAVPGERELRTIVGPPLTESFTRFCIPRELAQEAVTYYRKLYAAGGLYENTPYPGIRELLQSLKDRGLRLFVATSKPENMARKVLEHFDIAHYFERICGSAADGIRDKKSAVIAYLLENVPDIAQPVMVGDTIFDVLGAAELNIRTIGVSWGYGEEEAMLSAGAIAIADTAEALYPLLTT